MDLFLNELSLSYRSFDRADAHRRMKTVVDVISLCAKHGNSGPLRTLRTFLACALCGGYTIRHWLGDNGVPSEQRSRFKTAVSKGPWVEECIEMGEQEGRALFEFHFGTEKVYGLGAAYLTGSPTVSLTGDVRFEVDPVRIRVSKLDTEVLLVEEKEVCSLTTTAQVTNRVNWLQDRLQKDIPDGKVAWEKQTEYFPNLIFCREAGSALRALSGREPYFYQICRHLFVLNSFCAEWPNLGLSALTAITWSEESDSTLNNRRLRAMREFNCPDGERRLFSPHSKPTGGNIRIHFLPLREQKKILIGYMGDHLPY